MEILVITSCSKKKLKHKAKAEDLYQGVLFKTVKDFVKRKNYDWVIISAKYGLVLPQQNIQPYDKQLKTKKDIEEIRDNVISKLKAILPIYDKVIVICGKRYREVIEPLFDDKFEIMIANNYQGYAQKVKSLC